MREILRHHKVKEDENYERSKGYERVHLLPNNYNNSHSSTFQHPTVRSRMGLAFFYRKMRLISCVFRKE
jgi:hypothetical protein